MIDFGAGARTRNQWGTITLLLCMAWTSAKARADVVVIVPPHVEQGVTSEQAQSAVDALARGLKTSGFDLVLPGQAGPAAESDEARRQFPQGQEPMNCVTPDCAVVYRELFDAVFAVQLSMFREPGAGISLTVVIVENTSEFFSGSANVEGGDIAGALRDAYQEARDKQAQGVGPWLTVSGTPEGAVVYLDGAEFGRVPITRRRVDPGVHRLVLRADGYATHNDSVDIPARIDHDERRMVALHQIDNGKTSPVASTKHKRHWLDYAVGGTAIAAGAVFVVAGIRDYAKAGDCTDKRENGTCERAVKSDGLSVINIVGGAAGMALGAATIWVGPFGIWLQGDTQHAALGAQGSF